MPLSVRLTGDGELHPHRATDTPRTALAAFGHVVEAWESDKQRQGRSARNTRYLARKFRALAEFGKLERLDDLTPDVFARWLEQLRTEGMSPGDPRSTPNTPKTINDTICSINAFYVWARRREYCTTNPIGAFDKGEAYTEEQRRFTPDEVAGLISIARSEELAAEPMHARRDGGPIWRSSLYWILATCGLRIGTAWRLAWEHVQVWEPPYCLNIPARILKQKRPLRVALSDTDAEVLRAYHAELVERGEPVDGAVWEEFHFSILTSDAASAGVRVKDDKGNGASWHCFRRFVGSELANLGTHPKVAQMRLGHADARTTLRHYTQVDDGPQVAAAQALGDKLGKTDDLGLTQGGDSGDTTSSPMLIPATITTTETPAPGIGDTLTGPGVSSEPTSEGSAGGSASRLGREGRGFESPSSDSAAPDNAGSLDSKQTPCAPESHFQDSRHGCPTETQSGRGSFNANTLPSDGPSGLQPTARAHRADHTNDSRFTTETQNSRQPTGSGRGPSDAGTPNSPSASCSATNVMLPSTDPSPHAGPHRSTDTDAVALNAEGHTPHTDASGFVANAAPESPHGRASTPGADAPGPVSRQGGVDGDTQAQHPGLARNGAFRATESGAPEAGSTPAPAIVHSQPPARSGTDVRPPLVTDDVRLGVPGRLDQDQLNQIAEALAHVARGWRGRC